MGQKISSKGWVVIPAEIRRKYGLKPGDEVNVIDYGGVISLVPVRRDPINEGYGMLKGAGPLLDDLSEERRRDLEVEERRYKRFFGDED